MSVNDLCQWLKPKLTDNQ
jgi:hypothetical protein